MLGFDMDEFGRQASRFRTFPGTLLIVQTVIFGLPLQLARAGYPMNGEETQSLFRERTRVME